MFHKLNYDKTRFYQGVPPDTFEQLCRYIKSHYKVVSLETLKEKKLNSKTRYAVITFDDGHKEIRDVAFPILKKLNLPFNINIDTEILSTREPQDFVKVYDVLNSLKTIDHFSLPSFGELNIKRMSNIEVESFFTAKLSELTRSDRRMFIDELIDITSFDRNHFSRMLTKQDLAFLHSEGIEIGSHSHTHAILSNLPKEEVEFELSHSKKILEEITGEKINVIAYPNGKKNKDVELIAKKNGYEIFLETDDQVNQLSSVKNGTEVKLKRINQYHQTLNEALFHTYGVKNKLKLWKR